MAFVCALGPPMMRTRSSAPGAGTPEPSSARRVSRSARPRTRAKSRRSRTRKGTGDGVPAEQAAAVAAAAAAAQSNFASDMGMAPEKWPALVLNADWQPLSYVPLSLWPWQEVVKAVFLDRVNVVATYDVKVRSPSACITLPSVVSLKRYQPPARRTAAFTRFNVFLRDMFECQYCGKKCTTGELTFDHVVPRCRGGCTSWENVVASCEVCNHAKGRKMLSELDGRFKLRNKPIAPSMFKLQNHARLFPPRKLHESWNDYIYWSYPMEQDKKPSRGDVGDSIELEHERWP